MYRLGFDRITAERIIMGSPIGTRLLNPANRMTPHRSTHRCSRCRHHHHQGESGSWMEGWDAHFELRPATEANTLVPSSIAAKSPD
jgi:hypothetical protein